MCAQFRFVLPSRIVDFSLTMLRGLVRLPEGDAPVEEPEQDVLASMAACGATTSGSIGLWMVMVNSGRRFWRSCNKNQQRPESEQTLSGLFTAVDTKNF